MAARSNQVANWLRELGVRRGDRLLLMLGNIAPLWEVILAAMKLGAVIMPASTLLGPVDLADRITRGQVRHVVTESAHAAEVPRGARRLDADRGRAHRGGAIAEASDTQGRGGWRARTPAPGVWLRYADSYGARRTSRRTG